MRTVGKCRARAFNCNSFFHVSDQYVGRNDTLDKRSVYDIIVICLRATSDGVVHVKESHVVGSSLGCRPARGKVHRQLWAKRGSIPAGKAGTIEITCVIAPEIDALSRAKRGRVAFREQSEGPQCLQTSLNSLTGIGGTVGN